MRDRLNAICGDEMDGKGLAIVAHWYYKSTCGAKKRGSKDLVANANCML